MPRDNFSKPTIDMLGRRTAYLCSNPKCRRPTIGPHTNINKAIITGVAAHITAASPGGPRYDASLTDVERSDIKNGIWLCASCSNLIDKDPDSYPIELLRKWKDDAEHETKLRLENLDYLPSKAVLNPDFVLELKKRKNLGIHPNRKQGIIDAGEVADRIIFDWTISWEYILKLFNNSKEPIYNLHFEVLDAHGIKYEQLPAVNNLRPMDDIKTEISIEKSFTGTANDADKQLISNFPEEYKGMVVKLSYQDENHNAQTIMMPINEVSWII